MGKKKRGTEEVRKRRKERNVHCHSASEINQKGSWTKVVVVTEPHTFPAACQGRSSKPHSTRAEPECGVQRVVESFSQEIPVGYWEQSGEDKKTSTVPKSPSWFGTDTAQELSKASSLFLME